MDRKDLRREGITSCEYIQQMRSINTLCAWLESCSVYNWGLPGRWCGLETERQLWVVRNCVVN